MSLFDPTILAAANASPLPVMQVAGLGDDAWLAASKALDTDAPVNLPGMLRPFLPWQGAAYLFAKDAIARWGGVLLGDDMGLGKTQVLLALANDAVANGGYAIVVVPTVAEAGYRGDLKASFPGLSMHVVKGRTVRNLPKADIYMISDDSLTLKAWMTDEYEDAKGKKHLKASAFVAGASIVLRDEIHRDKGNGGKPTTRAKVMLAVGAYMRSVKRAIVGATGTLLTNRPVEGYIPLQIIGGEALVTAVTPGAHKASGFLWRYCAPVQIRVAGGRQVTTFTGIDTDEAHRLHEYLRRTVYVRREKSDLGEGVLPHSGWIVTPLALTDDAMRRYRRVEKDFLALVEEEKGPEAMWRANRAQTIVQMNMLWEAAGIAKAEAAIDYAKQFTDEGEQVVMFYYHADTSLALAKALVHAGISYTTINGQVTGDARVDAVQEFQAGDAQVCLAQIKAAGMAVTLTAAPHAIFVQVPWSAGDLKQAADRILRVDDITRNRAAAGGKVQWHVLQSAYSDGDLSFDAAMWTVLETKAHVCDAVNAGREITMPEESVMYAALMAWAPSAKRHGGW